MYRVSIGQVARAEIAALPGGMTRALDEVITVLEIAPWSGLPQNENNPEGSVRHLLFGPAGARDLIYLVLENTREVHVLVVVWVGG